jgi:hypothetical protein
VSDSDSEELNFLLRGFMICRPCGVRTLVPKRFWLLGVDGMETLSGLIL